VWIGTDEAVAADGFGGRRRLEEKRELALGLGADFEVDGTRSQELGGDGGAEGDEIGWVRQLFAVLDNS
jgi:hypothetical protein